jgi:RNA polymerase sigma-70 factor (ECF subfamily)
VTHDGPNDDTSAIGIHLETLVAGAGTPAAEAARAALVGIAAERMQALARRMLGGSPQVRRWTETDDVVQNAMVRLYRALGGVIPNDPQHFVRLAALQVRRELIDLTRRLRNPESFAANHDTNVIADGSHRVDGAATGEADAPGRLAEWTRFHETADALPEDERAIFGMVWYLGLTQGEIANLLGYSPRTVRRRWDEAKRAFIVAFRDELPE